MIYAGIVAGGTGTRMGTDTPKQYLKLGDVTVLERCAGKFLSAEKIAVVYIAVHESRILEVERMFAKYGRRVRIVKAGETRNDTLVNIVEAVFAENEVSGDDILLTHDAARPFVSERIIEENISAAIEFGVCTTALRATDTMLVSSDGETVSETPDRNTLFHAQTPQSFKLRLFREIYSTLSDSEKAGLTDVCGIFSAKGVPVHIIEGERENFKLTSPIDLKLAETLI